MRRFRPHHHELLFASNIQRLIEEHMHIMRRPTSEPHNHKLYLIEQLTPYKSWLSTHRVIDEHVAIGMQQDAEYKTLKPTRIRWVPMPTLPGVV